MTSDLLGRLSRVRFTVGYMAALFAVSTAMLLLSPEAHDRVIRHASTNLHNLSQGRLTTLVGSAFVVEAGPLYFWMPFLACLLVLAELQLHTVRLVLAFMVGHVGTTLVVAAALALAVKAGWMPWSITRASDVGMSYGALAVLGALTATIPRSLRVAWVTWWVAVSVSAAAIGGEFTNAGHTVAVILGMLVSMRLGGSSHWTPARCVMLVGSIGFGFLILAHSMWGMAVGITFGVVGAVLAHRVSRLLTSRSHPREHDESVPEQTRTSPLPALSVSA